MRFLAVLLLVVGLVGCGGGGPRSPEITVPSDSSFPVEPPVIGLLPEPASREVDEQYEILEQAEIDELAQVVYGFPIKEFHPFVTKSDEWHVAAIGVADLRPEYRSRTLSFSRSAIRAAKLYPLTLEFQYAKPLPDVTITILAWRAHIRSM